MDTPRPFARVLQWLRSNRRSAPGRAARFAPVALERLEERVVTAGLSGSAPLPYTPEPKAWAGEAAPAPAVEADKGSWGGQGAAPGQPAARPVGTMAVDTAPPWGGAGDAQLPAAPEGSGGWDAANRPLVAAAASGVPSTFGAVPRTEVTSQPAVPGDSAALPAVRASVNVAGPQGLGDLGFRITRTPAGDTRLEVAYTLTTFSGTGSAHQEGVATVPPKSPHVAIAGDALPSTGVAARDEIVTLTLRDHADYQVRQPTATLFLAGAAGRCSEAALLAAYRQGQSAEAFGALIARHRTAVLQTCRQVLGSWHDAEDVSQLVFLSLAQHPVRLHSTLAGWLRAVARNASIAFLRSRRRRRRHEQRAARPVLVAPEDSAHDLREELDAALRQVAGPLREAVRLRYLEGWSQHEAARIVGCPRGTLSQRAALGLRSLRGILGANDGGR